MSCKNEGCCRREQSRADMTMLPDWVVAQLLTVAQTGFKNLLPWPNESVSVLAEKIAALVGEVEMLRKLLNVDTKPNPVVDGDTLTFTFGPDNRYSLHMPAVSPKARKQLANNLAAAALELQTIPVRSLPNQLDLPFTE